MSDAGSTEPNPEGQEEGERFQLRTRVQRLEKLARLRERGIEPYPVRFDRDSTAAEVQRRFEGLATGADYGVLWALLNLLMAASYAVDALDDIKGILHRSSQVVLGAWLIALALGGQRGQLSSPSSDRTFGTVCGLNGRLERRPGRGCGIGARPVALSARRRVEPSAPIRTIGAMARSSTSFFCQSCGHESLTWSGRCAGCGEWNTLVEAPRPESRSTAGRGRKGSAGGAAPGRPVALRDVSAPTVARLQTGIDELDRVLGGGLVPGSLVLLGGSPGIGKSTLTGMALGNLGAAGHRVLYISGEESNAQVRLRAERLGPAALAVPALAETSLEAVIATLEAERPQACVIDSIQTLHAEGMTGSPGSVGQVKEASSRVMEVAKRIDCSVVLVGHVTKEGAVAGPRVLEHLVDCVLFFEGERERSFRTLRALKNRFGATSEVGVFEMRSGGLVEVVDPSARFVAEASAAPGSVVLSSMEGTRPLLVEVQALVAPTEIVPPRRVANGIDRNRLAMVIAVLARHGGPSLAGADVFVNVAGGVRIDEPGADLAVALALVSAQRGEALADADGRPLACFGEVGLTGELRPVGHADRRAAEAVKFGLRPVLAPSAPETPPGVRAVSTLREAIRAALQRRTTSDERRAA